MSPLLLIVWVSSLVLVQAAAEDDESIDQTLQHVMEKNGVKIAPVIKFKNGDILYDLDEVLTPEQFAKLFGEGKESKRKAIRAAAYKGLRWTTTTIPYVLDGSYDAKDTKLVHDSMKELEQGTCLKFKTRSREVSYIEFINGRGCYSSLGMVKNKKQKLSLSKRGCRCRDTVLHEILHALGLIHEQQRPDRDEHVMIMETNVLPGTLSQFAKSRPDVVNYHGVPYDFSSVMHYGLKAFSKNGERTVEPLKDLNAESYIGGQVKDGLSFGDYKLLNAMYECGSKCKINCPKPGYVTKECKCIQKKDFYKMHCKGGEKTGWCYVYTVEKELEKPGACKEFNRYPSCDKWKGEGKCKSSGFKEFMERNCRKSCLC